MAHVEEHLQLSELEGRYRSASEATEARHFQVIWLLAKGHQQLSLFNAHCDTRCFLPVQSAISRGASPWRISCAPARRPRAPRSASLLSKSTAGLLR